MLTLKTGNIIQLRNGMDMLVMRNSTVGDVLLNLDPDRDFWEKLELYNFTVDLKYHTKHEFDIVKVWQPKNAYNINSIKDKGVLVYDRGDDIL